jgi:hypothetical protein
LFKAVFDDKWPCKIFLSPGKAPLLAQHRQWKINV